MSDPAVAVCCPRERIGLWGFIDGRYNLCRKSAEYGIETQILEKATIYIGEMRSHLSKIVAESDRFTHALFLDADSVPPEQGLKALLDRDVDIVSGLYFMRDESAEPVAYVDAPDGWLIGNSGQTYRPVREEIVQFLNENSIPPLWQPILVGDIGEDRPDLIEVDVCGAGFLLIRKEVLQGCNDWNMQDRGEDITWCERVKELGYKIWLDPGVIVGHIGFVPFSTAWFQLSCERLRVAMDAAIEEKKNGARLAGNGENAAGNGGVGRPEPAVAAHHAASDCLEPVP